MENNEINAGNNAENEINSMVESGINEMEGGQEVYRTVEDDTEPPMGFFQRIACLFAAPGKLMENISEHPKIIQPLIAILILAVPGAFIITLVTPITNEFMARIMMTRYGLDMSATMAAAQSSTTSMVTIITGVVSYVVMPLLISLLPALYLLICGAICKGRAKFGHYYSMMLHIYIVSAVVSLVSSILMVVFGTITDFLSVAPVFMPSGDITSFVYCILTAINVGLVWTAVLMTIGLKKLNDFSGVKAGVITAVYCVLSILITAVMSSFSFWILDITMGMSGL